MPQLPTYDDSAARKLLDAKLYAALQSDIDAARNEVLADVELMAGDVPPEKQPLDAGFIRWPESLLQEYEQGKASSLVGRMEAAAAMLRDEVDRLVVLGIGGSYMGMRALFEALCDKYHNERTRQERGGIPRLYFEGNNMDNDIVASLKALLESRCQNPGQAADRWATIVISKSGGTLETAAAFRVFRETLESCYGPGSPETKKYVIPVTGETGKLRDLADTLGYHRTFPIPDGIGGRFSVLTPVGLLPAAAMGIDLQAMLRGAADATEQFATADYGSNPVLDYVATCHLMEREQGLTIRVLATWGNRLEALGFWYDQLLSESLGKQERGATPLTAVNSRDLHSRGQQHQEGRRDKLITNLIVKEPRESPVPVPQVDASQDQDQLNRLEGKTYPDLLSAAIQGTNQAYAEDQRPTADLVVPRLDAYQMGALFQFFMLATALEGRLLGINPYGQPGVEAYKKNMGKILYG